ncbi:LbtU family siderophore porin [Marinobacterium weihaiense]|uniref:LbtU family siderophore porin n=1 Tax=Marinobacterium weihaiense TaxID=2851016 RepID=A0ABS6MBT9_9GAMM|nr:LbtU family siderophore porin [Marinobacterium weihaiense]MBV0933753.1 LbtU family siderophore porin [Marinobacterium weihaiense]
MKPSLLTLACAVALMAPLSVHAADTSVSAEIEALKQRIAELEARQAAQPTAAPADAGNHWTDRVSLGGKAEFLATHSELDEGSTNDLDVDTVELVVDAQVNEFITLSTTLKYEDEGADEEFFVDEAIAVIAKEGSPLSLTVGKTGIPFGVIESATWTDPLTDDLSDNTDDLAMLSYAQGGFSSDLYIFKGDQDNDDHVNNAGLNLGYAFGNGLSVGAGYLNNLGNTELFLDAGVDEKQSAWRINAALELGELGVSAEWIQADDFAALGGAKPSVWHLGTHYNTAVFGAPGTLALGYSESDEAAGLDLAEQRLAASVSRELGAHAELIAEYVREEGYADEDSDTLNLVLATYF